MRCGATRLHERPPARHQKQSQAREAQKLLGIDSDSDDEADVRTSGKGEMGKAASAARPKVGSVGAAAKATPTYGVPKLKPKAPPAAIATRTSGSPITGASESPARPGTRQRLLTPARQELEAAA